MLILFSTIFLISTVFLKYIFNKNIIMKLFAIYLYIKFLDNNCYNYTKIKCCIKIYL